MFQNLTLKPQKARIVAKTHLPRFDSEGNMLPPYVKPQKSGRKLVPLENIPNPELTDYLDHYIELIFGKNGIVKKFLLKPISRQQKNIELKAAELQIDERNELTAYGAIYHPNWILTLNRPRKDRILTSHSIFYQEQVYHEDFIETLLDEIDYGWNVITISPKILYEDGNEIEQVPIFIQMLRKKRFPFKIWPVGSFQEKQPEAYYNWPEFLQSLSEFPLETINASLLRQEVRRLYKKFADKMEFITDSLVKGNFIDIMSFLSDEYLYKIKDSFVTFRELAMVTRIRRGIPQKAISYQIWHKFLINLPFFIATQAFMHTAQYTVKKIKLLISGFEYFTAIWRKWGKESLQNQVGFWRTNSPNVLLLDFYQDTSAMKKGLQKFIREWRKAAKDPKRQNHNFTEFVNNPVSRTHFGFLLPDADIEIYAINAVGASNSKDKYVEYFDAGTPLKIDRRPVEFEKTPINGQTIRDAYEFFAHPCFWKRGDPARILVIQNPLQEGEGRQFRLTKNDLADVSWYFHKKNFYLTRFPTTDPKKFSKIAKRFYQMINKQAFLENIPFLGIGFRKTLHEFFYSDTIKGLFNLPNEKRIDVDIYEKNSKKHLMQLNLEEFTVSELKHFLIDPNFLIHIYDISLEFQLEIARKILNNDNSPILYKQKYYTLDEFLISSEITDFHATIKERKEFLQKLKKKNGIKYAKADDILYGIDFIEKLKTYEPTQRELAEREPNDIMKIRIALRDGAKCAFCDKTTFLEYHHIWMHTSGPRLASEHISLFKKALQNDFNEIFGEQEQGPTSEWNLILLCDDHSQNVWHHPTQDIFTYQSFPDDSIFEDSSPQIKIIYNLLYEYMKWYKKKHETKGFSWSKYNINLENGFIDIDGDPLPQIKNN